MFPIRDEAQFFKDFPRLVRSGPAKNFRITSPASTTHNCVAFIFGDLDHHWWPPGDFPLYWPSGCPDDETIDAFVCTLAIAYGYEVCDSPALEHGLDKVALWAKDGHPKHLAMLPHDRGGWWRSKIGFSNVDVEHELQALSGPRYGEVVVILSRPRARKRRRKIPLRSET